MNKPKIRFYTEKDSFGVEAAVILFSLSSVFRLIGCWGLWNDRLYLMSQILLPMISALLFILLLVLLGKVALWSTSVPLLMGVAFFILKALGFESTLHAVLCILLYVAVAVLYCGTVFNVIRTKWLLVPLFGLPLLYHILIEDLPALNNLAEPVTFSAGMQEMSVLSIMLALLCTSLAMKIRLKDPPPELPKIKDPKVIPPVKPAEQESAAPAEPAPEQESPAPAEPAPDEPAPAEPIAPGDGETV